MDQVIKERWIAALESGEYQQGHNQLHVKYSDPNEPDRFCCLGVLCDLAYQDGVVERVPSRYLNGYEYGDPSFYEDMELPIAVRRWAGLKERNPTVRKDGRETSLAVLNDTNTSFQEIADIIRMQL